MAVRAAHALLLALAQALLTGCDSESDVVCSDVANCSHGGSDAWVTACREQNDELTHEAEAVGCDSALGAYFSCAEAHFECQGNQSSFPRCEPKLADYSMCLATRAAGTACAELEAGLAGCDAEAGSPTSGMDPAVVLSPCSASGDCSARCYLDSVPNLCAPLSAQLSAFADCASHCVF